MKINFIIPFHHVTGGIRVIFELSNELVKLGHDVNVIYPIVPTRTESGLPGLLNVVKESGKRLFTTMNWFALNARLFRIPSLSSKMILFAEKLIPDADVTLATQRSTAYFVSRLSSSKGRKFYFIQHYEIWPLWSSEDCWDEAKKINKDEPSVGMAGIKPATKELTNFKNYVDESYFLGLNNIVTSSWEAKIMRQLNAPFIGSIPYGVNFEMFYPSPSKEPYHLKNKITVLSLFRNSSLRGDNECIDAFKELNEKHSNLNFLMFGEKRNDQIPDFIDFHENPSQKEIRKLYQQADIMVYATWVEGYGMPPMEALACGTALISTDVGAVKDYSPEGYVSFIPIQNTDEIIIEIEKLINDPNKVLKMKEKGLEKIKHYTWENAALNFESHLKNLTYTK